jgi:hypothetical protein
MGARLRWRDVPPMAALRPKLGFLSEHTRSLGVHGVQDCSPGSGLHGKLPDQPYLVLNEGTEPTKK